MKLAVLLTLCLVSLWESVSAMKKGLRLKSQSSLHSNQTPSVRNVEMSKAFKNYELLLKEYYPLVVLQMHKEPQVVEGVRKFIGGSAKKDPMSGMMSHLIIADAVNRAAVAQKKKFTVDDDEVIEVKKEAEEEPKKKSDAKEAPEKNLQKALEQFTETDEKFPLFVLAENTKNQLAKMSFWGLRSSKFDRALYEKHISMDKLAQMVSQPLQCHEIGRAVRKVTADRNSRHRWLLLELEKSPLPELMTAQEADDYYSTEFMLEALEPLTKSFDNLAALKLAKFVTLAEADPNLLHKDILEIQKMLPNISDKSPLFVELARYTDWVMRAAFGKALKGGKSPTDDHIKCVHSFCESIQEFWSMDWFWVGQNTPSNVLKICEMKDTLFKKKDEKKEEGKKGPEKK
eukprot:Platyproteum_vivax@DN6900_c0_g1_i2.p1